MLSCWLSCVYQTQNMIVFILSLSYDTLIQFYILPCLYFIMLHQTDPKSRKGVIIGQRSIEFDNLIVMLVFHVFSATNHTQSTNTKTLFGGKTCVNIGNGICRGNKKDELIMEYHVSSTAETITHYPHLQLSKAPFLQATITDKTNICL